MTVATHAPDPDVVRHYLGEARYYPDDDLHYQIAAIEHVFWLAKSAGIDYGTEYLDLLAAQQAACRQALAERARHGYAYHQPRAGYERAYIDELKRRVPLLDVIGDGLKLRRQGKNYVGLCPFHQERTPSFTVFPATASYYCFGCARYGDAIDWLRQLANMDFREAVETLEVLAGVTRLASRGPAPQGQSPTQRGHTEPRRQLSDASPLIYHAGKVRRA